MRKRFIFLGVLLIILSVSISGCSSDTPSVQPTPGTPTQQTTTAKQLSTIEPSEMALQLSDLPANFIIQNRVEKVRSDVNQEAINLGWKSGYLVTVSRTDLQALQGTVIDQTISIYPVGTLSKVLLGSKNVYQNLTSSGFVLDELSNPQIGDQSKAFRLVASSDGSKIYIIDFTKKDVYESLRMTGKTTDYELLKDLAKIAAAKIK